MNHGRRWRLPDGFPFCESPAQTAACATTQMDPPAERRSDHKPELSVMKEVMMDIITEVEDLIN